MSIIFGRHHFWWMKLAVLIFSNIFIIFAILVITIGAFFINHSKGLATFSAIGMTGKIDIGLFILMIGILVFINSVIGAVGVLREIVPMLSLFTYGLLVGAICFVTLGISAIVIPRVFEKKYHNNARSIPQLYDKQGQPKMIVEYFHKTSSSKAIIDMIQADIVHCCGLMSYNDWNNNEYFSCNSTNHAVFRCSVPYSCCIAKKNNDNMRIFNKFCGKGILDPKVTSEQRAKKIYTAGCVPKMINWMVGHMIFLAVISGICVLIFLVVIFMTEKIKSYIQQATGVRYVWCGLKREPL